jgi:hypothetical protein
MVRLHDHGWFFRGNVMGTYTFRPELGNHILARHTTSIEGCEGPSTFDCDHGDLLYVYQDGAGQPLKANYFDNEGHVIHYDVSTPNATTAIFLSDASNPGPQFRLMYELKDAVMQGRFQMRMPGQNDWKSYLEWRGRRSDLLTPLAVGAAKEKLQRGKRLLRNSRSRTSVSWPDDVTASPVNLMGSLQQSGGLTREPTSSSC